MTVLPPLFNQFSLWLSQTHAEIYPKNYYLSDVNGDTYVSHGEFINWETKAPISLTTYEKLVTDFYTAMGVKTDSRVVVHNTKDQFYLCEEYDPHAGTSLLTRPSDVPTQAIPWYSMENEDFISGKTLIMGADVRDSGGNYQQHTYCYPPQTPQDAVVADYVYRKKSAEAHVLLKRLKSALRQGLPLVDQFCRPGQTKPSYATYLFTTGGKTYDVDLNEDWPGVVALTSIHDGLKVFFGPSLLEDVNSQRREHLERLCARSKQIHHGEGLSDDPGGDCIESNWPEKPKP